MIRLFMCDYCGYQTKAQDDVEGEMCPNCWDNNELGELEYIDDIEGVSSK